MPQSSHRHPIVIRRVYEATESDGSYRVLVDRLWPRGVRKEALHMDTWARDLAPSDELRKWFGHDPQRWDDFQFRYLQELGEKPALLQALLTGAGARGITLLYSARDEEHNQAVVLREALESFRDS